MWRVIALCCLFGSSAFGQITTGYLSSPGAVISSNPGNPTGTTSTAADVQMGLAVAFTPTRSGKVYVTLSGSLSNNTATDGGRVQLGYGTGTAPVNGAAATGTACGPRVIGSPSGTNNQQFTFAVSCMITGLTVGTAYWLDARVAAITGGTAAIGNLGVAGFEF